MILVPFDKGEVRIGYFMKHQIDLRELLDSSKVIAHYIETQGKNEVSLPPIAVEYHWCATCNYNCMHCSYANRRKSNKCLNQEAVSKSVDDLIELGTKAVYLSGGGEPTTFKNWDLYAQRFLDNDIEVALITNSIMIKDNHHLMLKKFNYIAVSVYSTDENQYKTITGSNNFDKQFALPKLLKDEDSSLIVGARCVINSVNYQNIFNTYAKAIESGFDYIIFIPAVDYENNRIDLTQEQKESVLSQIESNIDKINPANTNLLNIQKNKICHYQKSYIDNFENPHGCSAIHMRSNAFINYDGNVYLCQPLIGNEEFSIGSLNEHSFKEIWNSKKHLKVIEKLDKRFAEGLCENCRAIGYNIKINEYTNGKNFDKIPDDNFL